jgi:nucleoside phosphorylase
VHIGAVITSNRLVDSEAAVKQLRDDFPDAIAGEMEAIGVHEAATLGIKPDWIVVKGISDWGHHKDDRAQPYAARYAADYVTHVISMGALRPRRFW